MDQNTKWFELPQGVSVEDIQRGDKRSVDKLIVHLEPLARRIIAAWCAKFPHRSVEVESEGLYALVVAVNAVKENKHNNPIAYTKTCIEEKIRNTLKEGKLVHVPRSVQDKKKEYAQEICDYTVTMETVGTNNVSFDVYDFYEKCLDIITTNSMEKGYIKLKLGGFTDAEAATHLGISDRYARMIRENLYARFNKARNNPRLRSKYLGEDEESNLGRPPGWSASS